MSDPIRATERLTPSEVPPPPPRRAKSPRRRPRFGLLRRVFGGLFALAVLAGLGGGAFVWYSYQRYAEELPTLDGLRHYQPRVMSRVYASDSRLVSELATERRIFVPLTAIPPLVQQAFISAEDQKFWTHKGIDPVAMLRAGLMDIQQYGQGRRPVGASTITQQVAKNMLLGNEVSIARKAKEAILAFRIEQTLPKERILELYLNEIYLGLSAYGVAAAAQTYFNKGLDELTLPEAAFLAVLPKAPNNYNPFRFADAAKARRDWVLDRMADDRAITTEQAAAAKATPIVPAGFRRAETVAGGEWFAEEVRQQLIATFGADAVNQGGLAVRTSLDPRLQAAADRALRQGLMAYDRSRGGWRGASGRVEQAKLRASWPQALAAATRPAGMLAEWRFGVVLESGAAEARVGWMDPAPSGTASAATPRVLPVLLSDTQWARPIQNGGTGPAPRRMTDIVQPGDLVMIEPQPAQDARGRAQPERALLRQIPMVQGALAAINPATGRVLALSGGWAFESSQFNRATQAARQPGSSFKPFVYLTALQAGFAPSQRVLDAPFIQNLGAAGVWKPNNYGLTFHGPTPMRIALEQSLNLVTVRLAEKVGMAAVADTAIAFHVVDSMPKVLPASLGAVETTVLRQTAAYAGLAMGGKEVLPTLVDSVQDRDGRVLWQGPGFACEGCADPSRPPRMLDQRRQLADPQSTFQLITMMQGVVRQGSGTAAAVGLPKYSIAGKTGTSQDFNDAWFAGFTPDLVCAVWLGFDTNASLGDKETGGALAAPIWNTFMQAALRDRPALTFAIPDGVRLASWDTGSGTRTDAFKTGQEPGSSQGTIGGGQAAPDMMAGQGQGMGVGVDSGVGGLY